MIDELRKTYLHGSLYNYTSHLILFSLFEVDLLGGNDNPLRRIITWFNTTKKSRWSNYTTKGKK